MSKVRHYYRHASIYRALWFCALSLIVAPIADRHHALGSEPGRFLVGELLVATPEMKDPRFAESVIYMVKHDHTGAMGLVISKPVAKAPLDELLIGLGFKPLGTKREIVIHYGGPVAPRRGFLLHTDDYLSESTKKIARGIAVTTDINLLETMARGEGPRQVLFMLGYAGWAPGQLEGELKMNSWFAIPGEKALIFDSDAGKKWRRALDKRQVPL